MGEIADELHDATWDDEYPDLDNILSLGFSHHQEILPTHYEKPKSIPNGKCKYCGFVSWLKVSELYDLGWISRSFDKMDVCPKCISRSEIKDKEEDIKALREGRAESISRKTSHGRVIRTLSKTGRLIETKLEAESVAMKGGEA